MVVNPERVCMRSRTGVPVTTIIDLLLLHGGLAIAAEPKLEEKDSEEEHEPHPAQDAANRVSSGSLVILWHVRGRLAA